MRRHEHEEPLLVAEILRDTGDWRIAFGATYTVDGDYRERIEDAYAGAWEWLGHVDGGEELRKSWFSATTPVSLMTLESPLTGIDSETRVGYVELRFDLDEYGVPDDVEVIDAFPAGLMEREAIRHVRQSRFRPNMADGKLVASTHSITFEFEFAVESED